MLIALIGIVDWSVFSHGLPMLRHDWRFPRDQSALGPMLATFFEGWLTNGIGEPQPYPTFYYLGFVLWPLHVLRSPLLPAAIIVTAAVIVAACSAYRIGINRGSGVAAVALAIFALINPWVYTELVAGHIVMVLAYALLLGIVAEISRPRPRGWALIVLSALLITQIEFWAVAFIPFMAWCVIKRRYAPVVMGVVSVLPIVVGIFASYHTLIDTTYNLEWQRAQSLAPQMAFMLLGYPFSYAESFVPWRWLIAAFGLAGLIGMVSAWRSASDRTIALIALSCIIFATGTRWPLAVLYTYLVLHVIESGVFRELFDLLAFALAGYIVLAAYVMRNRAGAVALAGISVLLFIPWLQRPPSFWFVPAAALPSAAAIDGYGYRVAYLPAFQPLKYDGRGSGVDPDAFPIPGKLPAINTAAPAYPVDAALASAYSGDLRPLSALSVRAIVVRPAYSSDWRILRYQLAFRRQTSARLRDVRLPGALPLTALYPGEPRVASIGGLGENSIAPMMAQARIFAPDRTTLDPSHAWIDARTAFVDRPSWGNPWGGVATSSRGVLAVPAGSGAILAQTSGKLLGDGRVPIAHKTATLHWWKLPADTQTVICLGECIAVATLPALPAVPEHAGIVSHVAIAAHIQSPWFTTVEVPPTSGSTLRYNVRYDRHWAAFSGGRPLDHFALDGVVNGWFIPPSKSAQSIVLVETVAALQVFLEIVAVLALVILLAIELQRRFNEPESPPRSA